MIASKTILQFQHSIDEIGKDHLGFMEINGDKISDLKTLKPMSLELMADSIIDLAVFAEAAGLDLGRAVTKKLRQRQGIKD